MVVAYGLSERLLPGVFELDRSASAAGRLEQPLTYWNAMGLSPRLASCSPRAWRAIRTGRARCEPAWRGAAVPLGLGVYLSFARGALAALAVGLLVLVALAPERRAQLRSAVMLVARIGA